MRLRWGSDRVLYGAAALGIVAGLALGLTADRGPVEALETRPAGRVERFITPEPVPVPDTALAKADSLVRLQVRNAAFPGAVLAIGNRGLVQRVEGYGRTRWGGSAPEASPDSTRYDLASLTKVVTATAAVMALVEDGRMRLDDPVRQYVPEFSGGDKNRVTIRQLLTHTGGLRAGAAGISSENPTAVRSYLLRMPLALEPGEDVLYSDVGFVALYAAAQRAAGEPLPRYLKRRVWGPLGMTQTRVGVSSPCAACAPTLHLEEQEEPYTGGSYDEVARRLNGYSGNAGTFSTARDLSLFAAMIANEGRLGNVRVFQRRTIRGFTRAQPGAGTRALGWEVYCREGKVDDSATCKEVLGFGHTGVTGTSLWIDPRSRTWVVLLTNRTYLPKTEIDMQLFRRRVFRAATGIPPPPG